MSRVRGFTLLEVVVAVAILGLSVAVAMQIFSGGLKNVHRIDLAHQAMSHAENVLNQVLADESIFQPQELAGDLDENFRYVCRVDYWEPPEGRLALEPARAKIDLLSVVVEVHFKNDRYGKLYRIATLKAVSSEPFQPGPVDPAEAIRQLFGQ